MISGSNPVWSASFVASPRTCEQAGNPAPYFRSEFDVEDGLVAATLYVTGLGIVEAHLNGTVVGDEVLCPGWTSYQHRVIVSSHDVTELVRGGRNTLGAIAGEGWAVGRVSHVGHRNLWSDRPAVFLQLELVYDDHIEVVGTDDTWRTGTGAFLADGMYDGETFDARLEPIGWDRPGFDDDAWSPVIVLDRDVTTLELRSSPPIRRIEEVTPHAIATSPTGGTVLDFGQVIAGWVRLRVEGPAGTTVTIRHSEFAVAGEPDFEPNRTAEATDRYTLRGGGVEEWEPRFTFHGFRYVVVDGWPGNLQPGSVTAVVIHSDLVRTGWFECSDERLNRLHQNAVWSWRGNSVGLPTDCPQRDERLGWTGDINAFARTAVFLSDVRLFLGSWLRDLAAEQEAQGVVPAVVPDALAMFKSPTALWGDVAVSLPWLLYQHYGDRAVLERQYPSMKAFIESVLPALDEDGLWSKGFQFGDWVDPDSPPDKPSQGKTEPTLVAQAYLHKTTGELASAARVLGKTADAARYEALREQVRQSFRDQYVTPAGRLANESQTAYALAICFGLFDDEQLPRAGSRLVDLVKRARYRISTGFAGTPWVHHALTRTGHDDIAYRLLLETGPPSFLYPLTMGATTIWERWDAVLPDGSLNSTGMTSLNHYALGAVVDWIHRRIGGLAPLSPGYRVIEVAPRPGGGLTWARTELDTALGRISVHWRDDGPRRQLELTVPDGATARVVLPDHPDELVVEVGPGEHLWFYELPPPQVLGLSTPFEVLREDAVAWTAISDVVGRIMPGVPNLIDYVVEGAPDLATALPHLPDLTPELEAELRAALLASESGGARTAARARVNRVNRPALPPLIEGAHE